MRKFSSRAWTMAALFSTVSAFILAAGVSEPASADMVAPGFSCSKPYKPDDFKSESEAENFNDQVQVYKKCISDFADEQNEAAARHRQAAGDAIDEWNNFINDELDQ